MQRTDSMPKCGTPRQESTPRRGVRVAGCWLIRAFRYKKGFRLTMMARVLDDIMVRERKRFVGLP